MALLVISFIAGALTALAPCIISLLPIIIGGSLSGDRSNKRAFVVTASLGVSVIVFTLLLKASTVLIDVHPQTWQLISGGIVIVLGMAMVFPALWDKLPFLNRVNRDANKLVGVGYQKQSFRGDILVGAALGPVFASCSPTYFLILATVLPASFALGLVYLIVYALGLSLMLMLITVGGQKMLDIFGVASDSYGWFKRTIGVLFVIVGLGIVFGIDKKIQVALSGSLIDTSKIEQYLLKDQISDGLQPDNPGGTLNTTPMPSSASTTVEQSVQMKSTLYPRAPEITQPSGFVNTDGRAVTLSEYRGKKVVLVDFWTYSCINCIRTTPYLVAWYEKYKDEGLEIVGVHTPEFAFEHLIENVSKAVGERGIKFPVVLDNDYATWNAFKNQYWPRKYLVDIDGFIVYDHAGEGAYEETEEMIRKALAERAERFGRTPVSSDMISGDVQAVKPDSRINSPEIYFGAWRNNNFGNGTQKSEGVQVLKTPKPMPLKKNVLYLYGTWDIKFEFARNTSANAEITFNYDAKNVYMVARAEKPVRVRISIDGEFKQEITVREDKLYDIVMGEDYGEHVLDIKIVDPGLDVYTFTFG
ncbi:MAG: redoxin family protein [Candidatus Pacebacteria bacterium]|nr:redoxin family protein [Candidatus Paceibacterota bacterium]